jgi:hypothetical protein
LTANLSNSSTRQKFTIFGKFEYSPNGLFRKCAALARLADIRQPGLLRLARLADIRQPSLLGLARLAKAKFCKYYASLASLASLANLASVGLDGFMTYKNAENERRKKCQKVIIAH